MPMSRPFSRGRSYTMRWAVEWGAAGASSVSEERLAVVVEKAAAEAVEGDRREMAVRARERRR